MLRINAATDDMLRFAVNDCSEAIRAMPLGHKSLSYMQEARACQIELDRRAKLRAARSHLRGPSRTNYDKQIRQNAVHFVGFVGRKNGE